MQRSRQILESTMVKKNFRYETGLLWKSDEIELPNSYNMALKRLKCLESKMAKDPQLKENFLDHIDQFLKKKYIRKLSPDELSKHVQRVWYLPMFAVFNPKKPKKFRPVWDAAAKTKNMSLNSMLLSGPDLLVPLVHVLRRFRERKVGIAGDIEEMYHQIRVRECDQDVQRFLWRDDPEQEPDVFVMEVLTFGSACSPSSAQFAKNKNAREFIDKFPRAVKSIVDNHYVDDIIDSTHTVEEGVTLVNQVKHIHQQASFKIRNFVSNSKELLEKIGERTNLPTKNLNISSELDTERILGMFWNTKADTFTYSLKFTQVHKAMLCGKYRPTKREVLRILMSVFDPLGLIANFLIYGKILLQEIWRSKIDWDEQLNTETFTKWVKWISALPNVEQIQIPRLYSEKLSPRPPTSIQLHIFVDASVEAYATAIYFRIEDDDGIDCCLVGAKTKVAPNKPMSVPRLELQGAVLGTRLAESIKTSHTLNFEKRIFWTDSKAVMGWINSEVRRYNQFVSFRIGEILESSDQHEWRWIPSEQNVADEATKSKDIPHLHSTSRWYKAPKFLYDNEKTWFIDDTDFEVHPEEELRPCFVMACTEIINEGLIDLGRFSQWNRLLRAQAYVLRFINNARSNRLDRKIGPLSQEELIEAENRLYRRAQHDYFADEIAILKYNENKCLAEQKELDKSSVICTFSPYLDEKNVLRVRGRIDAAQLPFDTKRPIILPRRHQITKLVVDFYHRRYKHINHSTALNEIRQKYQIPALRVVMKAIRSSCQRCRNVNVTPQMPEMSELPPARLAAYTLPYTFVGVDYFGPIHVRVNRHNEKRWAVLFTCLTTRAVHIEIAYSLNTSSCIMAIENFICLRGSPRELYSDNGSNFHGADNELRKEFELIDQAKVEEKFTTTEMKWKFNPPVSPWMGGSWERLIQTVKNCLDQVLTEKTPTDEMLICLLREVSNIVNSRPLTYITLESAEEEAITPNHFILGTSNGTKPPGKFIPHDLLKNNWRAVQEMTNRFWRRFVLEYMPTLVKRTKWLKHVEPIRVGDVVVIIDEKNERNHWPKGIVEEVVMGKGGQVRQAWVRKMVTNSKGCDDKITLRPAGKLAVLNITKPNEAMEEVKLDLVEPVNQWENVGQQMLVSTVKI